jgi:hypothetical protein
MSNFGFRALTLSPVQMEEGRRRLRLVDFQSAGLPNGAPLYGFRAKSSHGQSQIFGSSFG